MTIGERIKAKRIELGLSQEELAKKCGYKSRSSINKIELARDLPLKKVEVMATALECSPSYLMGWDSSKIDIMFKNALIEVVKDFDNKQKEDLMRYAKYLRSEHEHRTT